MEQLLEEILSTIHLEKFYICIENLKMNSLYTDFAQNKFKKLKEISFCKTLKGESLPWIASRMGETPSLDLHIKCKALLTKLFSNNALTKLPGIQLLNSIR